MKSPCHLARGQQCLSPSCRWHQGDRGNVSFLQETSREVGSQARRLAYCLNGLLQKRPENWHDPAKIFGSVRLSKKAWLCHPVVSLGMQCLVLQNNGLSNSGKYSLPTHSHHGQESRLGATAVSTDCTDTAAISRGSWSCDLDWEGESLWTSAWSTLHWACSLKVYNTIFFKKTCFFKKVIGVPAMHLSYWKMDGEFAWGNPRGLTPALKFTWSLYLT